MDHTERLLTTGEAALRLNVSKETVRRWSRSRRLAHVVTPSGRLLFRPDDLDAAFQRQPVEPVSA